MSIANKVTDKAGSNIASLGLGGGTVKKPRKAKARRPSGSKSPRSPARSPARSPGKSFRRSTDGLMVKKYKIKGKRVSKKTVKKTKRIKKPAAG